MIIRIARFKILSLMLLLVTAGTLMSCSKGGHDTPTPVTPVKPPPTDGYKDPAAYGTPFTGVPDTKDIIMYEVNIRAFSKDANFKGVLSRLDSIKALGVNVIWLMPIYPVGQVNAVKPLGSPYAVKDYNAVNPDFGTLDDLRNIVSEAHKRNMSVILDWVADHTSPDNAWTANKSWYQQNASGALIPPPGTNYADVVALNYNSSEMRTAMIRAMKYWVLTANVDGYRCDYADPIPTDFWKQSLDTLKKFTDRKLIFLSEGSKQEQFTAGFQMNYGFSFYSTLKDIFAGKQAPSNLFTTNTAENNTLAAGGAKLRYSTNHDVTLSDGSTVDIYNGKQGALAAFVLAAYMNGVPLIYDGQEVGSSKEINYFANDPIDWITNPDMVAEYKKIIAFRTGSEAVKSGTMTVYNNADIIAFEKKSGTDDVLILVNARNSVINFSIPTNLQNTSWTNGLTKTDLTLTDQYTFQPYGYLVLKKK
ncbi:alpha-amylase family glycosyl hydrolase [Mucilaginibacter agri]|nr:alpha-amylase family glycosyl hydrolase [Mucilaginibacter agri]